MARPPAPRTGAVTASITAGGASSIADSGWVGGVGVPANRSPAPQRPTGVREGTAPSLVVGVELSPHWAFKQRKITVSTVNFTVILYAN